MMKEVPMKNNDCCCKKKKDCIEKHRGFFFCSMAARVDKLPNHFLATEEEY